MAITNYDNREINCKVVYVGPSGAGKTENLRALLKSLSPEISGGRKQLSGAQGKNRILDFLPISMGKIQGFDIRLHLYSLPQNIYVNSLPSVIFKGLDGIVFVADSKIERLANNVEEIKILNKINELNKDDTVSGILVQLPLPKHINKKKVIEAIIPEKDVDGFHPVNVGNLSSGYESSVPCTPLGCYLLIKKIEPNLSGKKAVVIGRSNLNGKPMTQLLLKENCTVTITHSKTKDLKGECLKGDIVVAAVGIPELVKGDWIKKDTIVIDVGINKTDKGIVGDVAFDEVSKIAKAITPVPGGVGPMTIACLLKNTIECFKRSQS